MIPRLGSKELGRGFLLGSWEKNGRKSECFKNNVYICNSILISTEL